MERRHQRCDVATNTTTEPVSSTTTTTTIDNGPGVAAATIASTPNASYPTVFEMLELAIDMVLSAPMNYTMVTTYLNVAATKKHLRSLKLTAQTMPPLKVYHAQCRPQLLNAIRTKSDLWWIQPPDCVLDRCMSIVDKNLQTLLADLPQS